MPPRPVLKVKENRPISAIYIGNSNVLQPAPSSSSQTLGTPSGLPDLPEPASPSSSIGSGLPSPPATNSTGSGSTGDPATIAFREQLHSNSSNSTSSGSVSTPMKRSFDGGETAVEDDDYDKENDNDNDSNDDTARLNENVMALQRVKNLAERNRMALHKLSRISSPSPHRPSPPRSGSETEREINSHSSASSHHHPSPSLSSVNLSHDSSEYHRSAPASTSVSSSRNGRRRKRASMASMSIQLTDFEEEDNDGLETATGTARNRTRDRTLNERDLITQSALAAVASSRRSPLGSKRRAALPKEFRSDLVDNSPTPAGPSTGRRSVASKYDTQTASIDTDTKRATWKQHSADPITPFRSNRPSTVRDYRRSGGLNLRWSVDNFTSRDRQYNASHSNEDGNTKRERSQTMRGGSAESTLLSPGGRSLIGEGLRAAGLSKRREEERSQRRVDWSPKDDGRRSVLPVMERGRLHPPRAATSMANYRYMDKDDNPDHRDHDTDRSVRELPSRDQENSLARAEASILRRERERDSILVDRAGSSFGRYNHNSHAHTPSPVPLLATPHHTHERLSTASPFPFSTRRLNSQTPIGGSSSNQTEHIKLMLESLTMFDAQLNRLPVAQLGKSGSTATATGTGASQTELARNAQSMVYAAERLSGLLKQGNGRAIEEQVEAEVEASSSTGRDAQEIGNIWGRVAAEYRENSRVADELVRGMTGFLLGMGRVVRDVGPSLSSSSSSLADYAGGSPSMHGRHASLDVGEEGVRLRREGVSPDVGSGGSGRRSASSRNSWEARERDRMAGAGASSGSGGAGAGGPRPDSVLARASPATYQKLRSDRELQYETPPPPSHQQRHFRQASIRKSLPAAGDRTEPARKLFTPREQREQLLDAKFSSGRPGSGNGMPTHDSQETVQPLHQPPSHEPSPTPASRTRGGVLNTQERERPRILPPLSIPRPLPTLPSESLVRRHTINNDVQRISAPTPNPTPVSTSTTSRDRRSTIRNALPSFPAITPPSNTTTALTPHTVSNSSPHSNSYVSAHTNSSGSGSGSGLLRTDSGRSDRSQVTFSRPLESASVSVSAALTGLQMQFTSRGGRESSGGVSPGERERDREGGKERAKEREREGKRRTVGHMRMSLDGLVEQMTHDENYRGGPSGAAGSTEVVDLGNNAGAGASASSTSGGGGGGGSRKVLWETHAADRSAAATFIQHPGPSNRRERRRTVTDIWPH